MENAPIFTISALSPYPGAEPGDWDRVVKWNVEVYAPLMMRWPARRGIDIYQIVKRSPFFPLLLPINHHENLATQQAGLKMPEMAAIWEDMTNWQKRNVIDFIWNVSYRLIKNFRSDVARLVDELDTRIENAPILHLEAYELSTGNQEKFNQWFTEYGLNIFVPLFMKQPGIKGYDYYRCTGFQIKAEINRGTEYPAYLSVVYFENMAAFENYERLPELTAFHKTMRNVFPRGLDYKWYVQYQLLKSWRK